MTDQTKDQCNVPPEGWYCTRKPNHDGPCAANQEEPHWLLQIMFTYHIARAIEQDRKTGEWWSALLIVSIVGLTYIQAIFALIKFIWKLFV